MSTGAKAEEVQHEYLDLLLEVSLASASSLDPLQQARAFLGALIRVFEAERAFLFLLDAEGKPQPYAGCDTSDNALVQPSNYSRSAVQDAIDRRQVVMTSDAKGLRRQSQSAVLHDLRMISAAPVMLREQLLGVVYLDARAAQAYRVTRVAPRVLQAVANQIGIAIETARLARADANRLAMERDLELTGALQSLLVPRASMQRVGRLSVAGYYRPASHCGGDWWWYEELAGGGLRVLLADVTGHGAAPAMLTATIAGSYHALRRSAGGVGMEELLAAFHDIIVSVAQRRYFMTVMGLEIDAAARSLWIWNAASCPAILMGPDGTVRTLGDPGRPLGQDEYEIGRTRAELHPGDRLLVCTDGLLELQRPDGRLLGPGGVAGLLRAARTLPPDQAVRELGDKVQALYPEQRDDVTFALIDVR